VGQTLVSSSLIEKSGESCWAEREPPNPIKKAAATSSKAPTPLWYKKTCFLHFTFFSWKITPS